MVQLKKVLSYKVILFITINSIIGSGMFFLPAIAARIAGPASIISWAVLSLVAIYTAMIFSEMVTMYPRAGGIYEFCKHAYGTFWSFLIGWIAWIVGNVTAAMLIVGAIQYLLPENTPFCLVLKAGISIFWVIIFNMMAYRGMKTSSFMLVTFSIITISIILVLIVPGFFFADPSNMDPFFTFQSPLENVTAVVLAIFFISEAFFGLESVLFLAEETKNPRKVFPKALLNASIIIALLTMVLVTVSLLVVPAETFGSQNAPFAYMAWKMFGPTFSQVIIIGTYLVIIGAAAGWIVSGPRLVLSLTRDKLFPPKFGELHPIYESPYNAIIFQAVVTSILIVVGFSGKGYETLLSILVPLVLVMISASIMAVLILRIRKPDVERPYKVPFPYVGPILVVFYHIVLVGMWLTHEPEAVSILFLGISIVLVGIPIYFFLQFQYNPSSVSRVHDALAYVTYLTERMVVPSSVRRKALENLGDLRSKTLLEYGCSVGTFTVSLAEEVGPYGKVYATDLSKRRLEIAKIRVLKAGFMHVTAIYDDEHMRRVHPNVPEVDCVTSVAALGNITRVDHVLSDMNRRMDVGGPVCFVEYDKFFHVISNINWLADDSMIKHIFRRNGFLVNVERVGGIFWQTVYIFGKKVMDVPHAQGNERIDRSDIMNDMVELKGLHGFVKEKVEEFKETIINREIGLIVYDDPSFDSMTFKVNPEYFGRIITTMFDSTVFFCPEKGDIIFKVIREEKSLKFELISNMETQMLELFQEGSEGSLDGMSHLYREHLEDLNFVRRLVSLGYRGHMRIFQIQDNHDPREHKHLREFIIGMYEENVIEGGGEYLHVIVTIPLINITD